MTSFRCLCFLTLLLTSFSGICAQESNPLPLDKDVTIGTLKNGLKYYILVNRKPEKRAELRLVVNAGSVLEDENQQGLAHFTEHMAFNGSKHFKKNELVSYLESIGVKFGPELNAFTSFDETVYMLQVPTEKAEIISKAFLVLEDWAHALSFDSIEVEKERGVITEEWRLGRGADARMMDKQFPILFHNSKYAMRLPIGDINNVKNFKLPVLKKFYHDWYRPDLMAVVAVGDFNKADIEKLIKENFENIVPPASERKREISEVPRHKETLFAIASDKEARVSSVSIYMKKDPRLLKTEGDYRESIAHGLFFSMLNDRFSELSKLPDPPFSFAYAGNARFVRAADINFIAAYVKDNGINLGLENIYREAERARQFGFTATELDRAKANRLSGLEQRLKEKDKTESGRLIQDLVSNYLEDEPFTGIEAQYDLNKKYLPGINLGEINKISAELLDKENRVILVNVPEKQEVKIPTEEELRALIAKVSTEKIAAYQDLVSTQPLLSSIPKPSSIVSSSRNDKIGTLDWRLSNGVRVILKPTNFKNDEIVFTSYMSGGTSVADSADFLSASLSPNLAGQSGLGQFSSIELQKMLAGKIANVDYHISDLQQGLNGNCTPKDQETMFQLIYKHFVSPRIDSASCLSYKAKMKSFLQNKDNSPFSAFSDTLSFTADEYNYRSRPMSVSRLEEIDPAKALKFLKSRFSNANGMTFVFAGNIDTLKFKPLVETYLGGLPSGGVAETWRDPQIRHPKGIVEKIVKKGIEPQSLVGIRFMGPFRWSRENEYFIESLVNVLDIRLREVVREDKGGTYGVWVSQEADKYPKPEYGLDIVFGCGPERTEELTKAVFSVIDSIKQFGPSKSVIDRVKEIDRKGREVNVKTNGFWMRALSSYLFFEEDPSAILDYNSMVDSLKSENIKNIASELLNDKNYLRVVLYPQK